jgi:GTP cyclohydrolase FolE2
MVSTATKELQMTITAKFASVCPCCTARITPGQKVEWSKGSPARHVTCVGSAVHAQRPAATRHMATTRHYRAPYGKIECDECGDYVTRGSVCWETGCRH